MERGARSAVGIELNPLQILKARKTAKNNGWQDKVTFLESDFMSVNLSAATVVLCYLFTTASRALKPKFESELKPGVRVVVVAFPVPGWKPVSATPAGSKQFYLYIMPPEKVSESETWATYYPEIDSLLATGDNLIIPGLDIETPNFE
jgi:hypothetical protein